MAGTYTPEQKAKIISAIKDDGVSINEAEKTFGVTDDTIRKWLRESASSAQSTSLSGEVQRLRRDNAILQNILTRLLIEREIAKDKSGARS